MSEYPFSDWHYAQELARFVSQATLAAAAEYEAQCQIPTLAARMAADPTQDWT